MTQIIVLLFLESWDFINHLKNISITAMKTVAKKAPVHLCSKVDELLVSWTSVEWNEKVLRMKLLRKFQMAGV